MSGQEFDIAALKKIGMIQQKQNGYFAMRLRAVAGDLTVEELRKIAEIAEKYGKGFVHLTTRQGVEIPHIHHTQIEEARKELDAVGLQMGACGPRIRVIVACPGESTCRWGIIDTKEVAKELDAQWFRKDTPHKFKLGATGCPHNCAKATENDIGVMGAILPGWAKDTCIDCRLCVNVCPTKAIERVEKDGAAQYVLIEEKCINCSICTSSCPAGSWSVVKKGYNLFIGGTMGKVPRLGTLLKGLIGTKEELYALVEKTIEYYRKHGRKKERFGHLIDRVGVEKVKEEILHGE